MDETPFFEAAPVNNQTTLRKKIFTLVSSIVVLVWFVCTIVAMDNSKRTLSMIHKDMGNRMESEASIAELVSNSNNTLAYIQELLIENNTTLTEMRMTLDDVRDTEGKVVSIYKFVIAICNLYPEYRAFCPQAI